MNPRAILPAALLAAMATFSLAAPLPEPQHQPDVTAHPNVDAKNKVYPLDQIITASVHDAWLLSGKNEDAFFDIVEQLAQISAEKRGISLPDNAAAGKRMGEMIKEKARADHDQLLYVIVDQAVRAVGKTTTSSAKK